MAACIVKVFLSYLIMITIMEKGNSHLYKCHQCNSKADNGCGETLTGNYSTTCAENAIGCRKFVIKDILYGDLIVRSCYNNTYTNHTLHFGNYTRNTCSKTRNGITTCFCAVDNCNGASGMGGAFATLAAVCLGSLLHKLSP